jgi:hypothetical protein
MSTTTIDIPGGQATLREELNVRQRSLILAAGRALRKDLREMVFGGKAKEINDADMSEADFLALWHLNEVMVFVLLDSWTLDRPLPAGVDQIGDLPTDIYDALMEGSTGAAASAMSGAGEFGPDGAPDPKSPTGPSSHSDGGLRGSKAQRRTSPRKS